MKINCGLRLLLIKRYHELTPKILHRGMQYIVNNSRLHLEKKLHLKIKHDLNNKILNAMNDDNIDVYELIRFYGFDRAKSPEEIVTTAQPRSHADNLLEIFQILEIIKQVSAKHETEMLAYLAPQLSFQWHTYLYSIGQCWHDIYARYGEAGEEITIQLLGIKPNLMLCHFLHQCRGLRNKLSHDHTKFRLNTITYKSFFGDVPYHLVCYRDISKILSSSETKETQFDVGELVASALKLHSDQDELKRIVHEAKSIDAQVDSVYEMTPDDDLSEVNNESDSETTSSLGSYKI